MTHDRITAALARYELGLVHHATLPIGKDTVVALCERIFECVLDDAIGEIEDDNRLRYYSNLFFVADAFDDPDLLGGMFDNPPRHNPLLGAAHDLDIELARDSGNTERIAEARALLRIVEGAVLDKLRAHRRPSCPV